MRTVERRHLRSGEQTGSADGQGSAGGAQLFSMSAERVISHLKTYTPITEWSVDRIAGGEQIHVHVADNRLLRQGLRVDGDETFCKRMVNGAARVVADSHADDDYVGAPSADGSFVCRHIGSSGLRTSPTAMRVPVAWPV